MSLLKRKLHDATEPTPDRQQPAIHGRLPVCLWIRGLGFFALGSMRLVYCGLASRTVSLADLFAIRGDLSRESPGSNRPRGIALITVLMDAIAAGTWANAALIWIFV